MNAVEVAPGLAIFPRSEWAAKPPTGPLESEALEDVRFLLVHHTASSNDYGIDSVAQTLRGFYDFHTGAEKQWPDIAYNFLVDRFGRVFEARQGSIESPIKGSATGGSQGFGMLCSFVGNHAEQPPSPEAAKAMGNLLGWLAAKYSIDIAEGVSTEFASRGSNRWPAGTTVTARTISGHREMSQTTCPGDFGFAAIDSEIAPRARAFLAELQPPETTTTEPPETTTTALDSTPTTTSSTTSAEVAADTSSTTSGGSSQEVTVEAEPSAIPTSWLLPAAAMAAVAGAIGIRRRRI